MNFEQLNPAACRTYLLSNETGAVMVDPVINHVSDYLELLRERNLKLTHVIDTHTHADHISAGPSLRDATDCDYIMHTISPAKCPNVRVKDGDELMLAGRKATVLETPGHTKDSISLLFSDMILTGDFLFLEDAGAGRDDLPGGDAQDHWNSLQKLKDLPDDLIVYPAHEYRDRVPSSLGNQRVTNPHLIKASKGKEEFINYIEELKLGPADWMKDVLAANYKCSTDPKAAWIPTDLPACEVKGTLNPNAGDIEINYVDYDSIDFSANPIIIDVREPFELSGPLGHIEGSINIPVGQMLNKIDNMMDKKEEYIITVCRSGARATTAAQILVMAGFTNVSVLEGGMIKASSK